MGKISSHHVFFEYTSNNILEKISSKIKSTPLEILMAKFRKDILELKISNGVKKKSEFLTPNF